jgi:hypothetical protein
MNQLTAANHNCTNLGVSYETHEASTICEIRCKYTCLSHSMSAKNGEHEEHVCAPHSQDIIYFEQLAEAVLKSFCIPTSFRSNITNSNLF